MQACNAAGCSGYSSVASAAMILRPDNAPQLVGIGINNSGNYTVSWSSVGWGDHVSIAGGASIRIQRRNIGRRAIRLILFTVILSLVVGCSSAGR
jgi:hypothetical protein